MAPETITHERGSYAGQNSIYLAALAGVRPTTLDSNRPVHPILIVESLKPLDPYQVQGGRKQSGELPNGLSEECCCEVATP